MDEVIELTQGDDLNAAGQDYRIAINTDEDLTTWKAVFQLDDFRQKWDDITSKSLPLIITREDSYKIKLGERVGALKIYDEKNLAKTVRKDIKFLIMPEVVENE